MKVMAAHSGHGCSPRKRTLAQASIRPQFRQWQRHGYRASCSWSARGRGNGANAAGIHSPGKSARATIRIPLRSEGKGLELGMWSCVAPRKTTSMLSPEGSRTVVLMNGF